MRTVARVSASVRLLAPAGVVQWPRRWLPKPKMGVRFPSPALRAASRPCDALATAHTFAAHHRTREIVATRTAIEPVAARAPRKHLVARAAPQPRPAAGARKRVVTRAAEQEIRACAAGQAVPARAAVDAIVAAAGADHIVAARRPDPVRGPAAAQAVAALVAGDEAQPPGRRIRARRRVRLRRRCGRCRRRRGGPRPGARAPIVAGLATVKRRRRTGARGPGHHPRRQRRRVAGPVLEPPAQRGGAALAVLLEPDAGRAQRAVHLESRLVDAEAPLDRVASAAVARDVDPRAGSAERVAGRVLVRAARRKDVA